MINLHLSRTGCPFVAGKTLIHGTVGECRFMILFTMPSYQNVCVMFNERSFGDTVNDEYRHTALLPSCFNFILNPIFPDTILAILLRRSYVDHSQICLRQSNLVCRGRYKVHLVLKGRQHISKKTLWN